MNSLLITALHKLISFSSNSLSNTYKKGKEKEEMLTRRSFETRGVNSEFDSRVSVRPSNTRLTPYRSHHDSSIARAPDEGWFEGH